MKNRNVSGVVIDLKISEETDSDAFVFYLHSIQLENEYFYTISSERKLNIRNDDALILEIDYDSKVISMYDYTSKESFGKNWKKLSEIESKVKPSFIFKEGVVQQKKLITEKHLYRTSSNNYIKSNSSKFNLTIDKIEYSISLNEGKQIKKNDVIGFMHLENDSKIIVFYNKNTNASSVTAFKKHQILHYSIILLSALGLVFSFKIDDVPSKITTISVLSIVLICTILFQLFTIIDFRKVERNLAALKTKTKIE